MSSQRGNTNRSKPQKYQNTTAFRNDKYKTCDPMLKMLNSTTVTEVCSRCQEQIEWKIKYGKYKPLTMPKKCVKCLEKKVTQAYRIMCSQCAQRERMCSKCGKSEMVDARPAHPTLSSTPFPDADLYVDQLIRDVPERVRRYIRRQLTKLSFETMDKTSLKTTVEELLAARSSSDHNGLASGLQGAHSKSGSQSPGESDEEDWDDSEEGSCSEE